MVYIKRDIEAELVKWLDSREIIAIRGTRQCGKTTILKRLMEILRKKNVPADNIHYISFEDDIEKEKFEKNPREYLSYFTQDSLKKQYFLLDEIQYIRNAGKLLKLVFDDMDNIKIIVTGSSTLDINEVGSFLVGRVLLFEMHPFSFGEFLESKDTKLYNYYKSKRINILRGKIILNEILFLEDLNKMLKEYLIYGGYPAVVLENDYEKKKFLLKNLFLTYIEKDIVKVYGSKYKQRINDLIRYLSNINTSIINYNEIAGRIGLYDKEIKEILHILEETYVIKIIKPFFKNLTTELKKNPRVYFIDTGLRNFISGRFDLSSEEFGRLYENYVLLTVKREKVNYWRTTAKAEVDFVVNGEIPIEVKVNFKITRSFRSFINTYKPKKAFLLNFDKIKKDKIHNTEIYIIPFCII